MRKVVREAIEDQDAIRGNRFLQQFTTTYMQKMGRTMYAYPTEVGSRQ